MIPLPQKTLSRRHARWHSVAQGRRGLEDLGGKDEQRGGAVVTMTMTATQPSPIYLADNVDKDERGGKDVTMTMTITMS